MKRLASLVRSPRSLSSPRRPPRRRGWHRRHPPRFGENAPRRLPVVAVVRRRAQVRPLLAEHRRLAGPQRQARRSPISSRRPGKTPHRPAGCSPRSSSTSSSCTSRTATSPSATPPATTAAPRTRSPTTPIRRAAARRLPCTSGANLRTLRRHHRAQHRAAVDPGGLSLRLARAPLQDAVRPLLQDRARLLHLVDRERRRLPLDRAVHAAGRRSSQGGCGGTFGWVLNPGGAFLLDVLDPSAAQAPSTPSSASTTPTCSSSSTTPTSPASAPATR